MADVLAHIDTLDVEVVPQEELDITVGSPMEHSRVLSITKNGKHVVSEYDLAEVEVLHKELQEKTLHLHDISTQSVFNVTADDKNKELAKVTVDVSEISKKVTGDGEDDIPKTNPVLAGGNADDYRECTDAEKTEWEEAYNKPIDPEPPQVEDTQADVVE